MIELLSEAKIAPKGKLNVEDLKKMGQNILIFTAPLLAVYFGQLALGVNWKAALPVVIMAFYGIIADFFKKISDGR